MALIAGFLLDSNNPDRLGMSNAEMQANLQKNIGDAVEMLPKLTTGLDVNILYHDIKGFEYTDVVAIFDLLDIQLVHGWLVDPQDKETVACIGNKSYNALIEHLVALTGSPAPQGSSATENSATVAAPETSATQAAETTPAPDVPGGLASSPAGTCTGQEPPAPEYAVKSETPEASALVQAQPAGTDAQQQADLLGLEYDAELHAALTLSLSQLTTTDSKDQPAQPDQNPKPDTEAPSATVVGLEHAATLPVQPQAAAAAGPLEGGSAITDGPDDYVVVSHPKAAVLVDGHAEPSASAGAALEPSQLTAADGQAMGDLQPTIAPEPAETVSAPKAAPTADDTAVNQAAKAEGAAKEGCLGAAAAVGVDKGGAAGNSALGSAAAGASGAATESMPASGDAAGDTSAKPEQAVPAGGTEPGQAVAGEGTEPEEAPLMGGPSQLGEAYLIQTFLDNTSSQLTHHGLVSLHAGLKPNQLAVFFRNNHFNTLFKYDDALYILVTDLGYLHERDVVWEKLDAIDGDTVFVTSTLQPPAPVDARAAAEQASADYALALQLHQEEQEAAERRRREAAGSAPAAAGRAGDALQPPQPAARTGQPGPPGPPRSHGPPGPQQQDGAWAHRHRHGRHHRAQASGSSRPGRPKQNVCSIM
ncbi:probable ubiquitin carboxyl-terminal hydrolase MINDY-2 [Coccomyxa sp. Obi]|nr:probable ubiquitin carboxyl-terminal hydrolase MINDY-2 [Coccomyxa sp. Obi]